MSKRVGNFKVAGTATSVNVPVVIVRPCEKGRLKSVTCMPLSSDLTSGRFLVMFGAMKDGILREHITAILKTGYAFGHNGLHWVGDYPLDPASNLFCSVVVDISVGFIFSGAIELEDP